MVVDRRSFVQVELSVLAPSGNDSVAEDMKNFSDQLKPLVNLDKYDLRRTS
jgi:mediator of RNA polymerase II transcription subunit 18